jgi:predicted SPOUT superfamily RNA methylase MTH1
MIGKNITIAIPASIITDTPHLREKTAKIGQIGRAAAIFRVNKIIVYPDNRKISQVKELDFITTLLTYLDTPPYLRKKLFGIDPKLKYAGILPPLRTPNHPLNRKSRKLRSGEYREGIIVEKNKEGMIVEIGVEKTALLRNHNWVLGDHIITQIIKTGKQIEVQTIDRDEIPTYWGFSVFKEEQSIFKIPKKNKYDLVIATSIKGQSLTDNLAEIIKKWEKANRIILEFGAPNRGLFEISEEEGFNLIENTDFILNIIPKQGTVTVRTEEALFATLSIFNLYRN